MYRVAVIAIATFFIATAGCAEGTLDTSGNDGEQDAGITDDTGPSFDDTGTDPDPDDTGNGGDDPEDAGNGDDPEDADNGDEDVDCCDPDAVQCSTSSQYIQCVADSDGCGQWQAPEPCPDNTYCDSDIDAGDPCVPTCSSDHPDYGSSCTAGDGVCEETGSMTCEGGELVCDATPGDPEPQQCDGQDNNCDGEVDSDGICGPCVDDSFAPDNHSSLGAADLFVGDSLDDLTLCDNQESSDSDNWFYLGYVSSFEVVLDWEEIHGPLGLDFYATTSSSASPGWLADAGTASSQLSYSHNFSSPHYTYARVRFRTDDKPPAGTPYSIEHN